MLLVGYEKDFFSLGVTTHCGSVFCSPLRVIAFSLTRFLDQKLRRATVGRTLLDE